MSMNVGKNPISLFSETCFPTQPETEKRKRNRNRNKKSLRSTEKQGNHEVEQVVLID